VHRARAVPPPPRPASFTLAIAAACCALSGCVVSSDLSGTSFLCADEPICPEGLVCVDGRCVAGEPPGPDSGGGGGGSADDGGTPPPLAFAFRQKLELDNLERGELRDFPVMVALEPGRFDYGAVRPDGGDLEFRDADGAALAHEIEAWNPDGRSILWVRVPVIDARSSSDFIYIYYGGDSAVTPDQASVWTRYESVYHLDGQDGPIEDSGARRYDGTPLGAEEAAGFLGQGQSFGGFDQLIDLGADRDFARAAPGVTLEAWVNPRVAQQGVIFGASVGTSDVSRVELRFELGQNLRGGARTQDAVDMDLQAVFTGELLPLDTWSWVALVCDFEAGAVTIYIDDHVAAEQGNLLFDPSSPDTASAQAAIGANESLDSEFFGGLLDEVRLAPVALDADWVSAQHASMVDDLVSYGAAEAL
jgi:hypothetical protein